mmetsp:Transcript_9044/g.15818  ORF Transcript_9044/g.15818 Transcript_9044/m.15818 type:complete len:92 (-) Transcript_9044:38-313(-)
MFLFDLKYKWIPVATPMKNEAPKNTCMRLGNALNDAGSGDHSVPDVSMYLCAIFPVKTNISFQVLVAVQLETGRFLQVPVLPHKKKPTTKF